MSTASCMILHRSRPEPWNGSDPRLKQAEYQETAFLFRRSAVSLHIQENMAFRGTKLHLTFGCFCVILKSEYDGIVPALEAVHRGQSVFGDSIRGKFTDLVGAKESFDYEKAGISEKEKGIIELVAKGQSNKEIAAELFLSEGTVRNYISGLLEKLELRDRTQLAVFYYTKIKK